MKKNQQKQVHPLIFAWICRSVSTHTRNLRLFIVLVKMPVRCNGRNKTCCSNALSFPLKLVTSRLAPMNTIKFNRCRHGLVERMVEKRKSGNNILTSILFFVLMAPYDSSTTAPYYSLLPLARAVVGPSFYRTMSVRCYELIRNDTYFFFQHSIFLSCLCLDLLVTRLTLPLPGDWWYGVPI